MIATVPTEEPRGTGRAYCLAIGQYRWRRSPQRWRWLMADFQNQVFAKYARVHGLPFIDVAARFPLEPDLFGDAIHMRPDGLRLHAWIALQQLVPLVSQRLARGEWPKPAEEHAERHPGFTGGSRDTTRSTNCAAAVPF